MHCTGVKARLAALTSLLRSRIAPRSRSSPDSGSASPSRDVRPLIAVLSVSAGNGHIRAAEALCSVGETTGAADMVHLDVMQFVPALFRKTYTDLYLKLVKSFPALWSQLYHRMDRADSNSAGNVLRRHIERACTARLRDQLDQLAPDVIVCTHFLPAEMLVHLPPARRPHADIWIQVTDYDLHRIWIQPGIAGYFVGSQQIAWRLRQAGIAAERIHVTGIPVMPGFAVPRSRTTAAAMLGIDRTRQTVLLMSGGEAHGGLLQLADALMQLDTQPVVLAVAGNNAPLRKALDLLATRHADRLKVFGFTGQIELLMVCADLVVSKPGGLTTAECLALGIPMIVVDCIPGQEERNADYLLEHGAAVKAPAPDSVGYRVQQLLGDPERLAAMRRSAQAIGRPHAAQHALLITLAESIGGRYGLPK